MNLFNDNIKLQNLSLKIICFFIGFSFIIFISKEYFKKKEKSIFQTNQIKKRIINYSCEKKFINYQLIKTLETVITIFTPTYNRRYIINNLFESLLCQNNFNFEWIVIDDGSDDNTEDYFANITNSKYPFNITFIKKSHNMGKHCAINDAVNLAKGKLFFIVDSDDYLTENAIERLIEWDKSLDNSHKWAGISGLKGYSKKKVIGGTYNKDFVDAKNNERERYNLTGDKAEAYYTEILKKYPFPVFENEKFIPESCVWYAIAIDGYYLRWFNEIIYIADYLEDGLTNNKKIRYYIPKGFLYNIKIERKAFPNSTKVIADTAKSYYEIRKFFSPISEIARDLEMSVESLKKILFSNNLIIEKLKKEL